MMEYVNWDKEMKRVLQMWGVRLGIGRINFALNAQSGGSWLMESACPFLTTARLTMMMVIVQTALTDTT